MRKLLAIPVDDIAFLAVDFPYTFVADGKPYRSALAYFLSHKYSSPELASRIACAETDMLMRLFSKTIRANGSQTAITGEKLVGGWDDTKVDVMLAAQRAKFNDTLLRNRMLSLDKNARFASRTQPWLARMLEITRAEILRDNIGANTERRRWRKGK